MTQVKTFAFGTIVGAGLVFVALQYHLVQSRDGFRLIPRSPQHSIGLAYADVRDWDTAQWADRPELMQALVAHGSTDLVTQSVTGDVVDSFSSAIESSAPRLDQMREMLESPSGDSDFDSLFDSSSESLKIPSFEEMAPADFGAEDGSTVPFPSEARNRNKTIDTARREEDSRARTPLDDIFSAGTGRTENLKPQSSNKPTSNSTSDPFRRSRPDRNYGDDENQLGSPSTGNFTSGTESYTDQFSRRNSNAMSSPTSDGQNGSLFDERSSNERSSNDYSRGSESIGSPKDNEDDIMGMFEDVSSALEREAEESLNEVTSRVRNGASSYMSESAKDADRFVRDRVAESLPDSISSIFPGGSSSSLTPFKREPSPSGYGSGTTTEEDLPSALRAIKEGFDPFID